MQWLARNQNISIAIQLFFVYAWLSKLPKSDSFFSAYCLMAIAGMFCGHMNSRYEATFSPKVYNKIFLFSTVFSVSVIAGNYTLFQPMTAMRNILDIGLCFTGGFIISVQIFVFLMNVLPIRLEVSDRKHTAAVFLGSFVCIVVLDLVYLFAVKYPAIIHFDTLDQLKQILGLHAYNNWGPYWHSKTVGLFLIFGYRLFSDLNAALAFYVVIQVLFIAGCFAYLLTTLYQAGIPKGFLWVAFGLYVLLPYNIAFNITIGKDVLFGVALLLMQTALYRILTRTGKYQVLNYVVFIIGSFGFSLWRTNGWYTYLVTGLLLFSFFRKKYKPVLYAMAGVLVVCWGLLNPYFDARGIPGGPATETMAIPFQQVARVVANEREIPAEEEAFLSELFDLDLVAEVFEPNSVDPIKFQALRCSQDCYKENRGKFIEVWLRLGLKYPGEYLTAWIDLTRGYWTGGFHMGVNDQGIPGNDLGIYHSGGNSLLARLFGVYFRCVEDAIVLEPLKSIGFVVWLVLFFWWISVIKKHDIMVLSVPALIILAGLWLGAPVFAEFRYGYPVFLISPLILLATVFQTTQETKAN